MKSFGNGVMVTIGLVTVVDFTASAEMRPDKAQVSNQRILKQVRLDEPTCDTGKLIYYSYDGTRQSIAVTKEACLEFALDTMEMNGANLSGDLVVESGSAYFGISSYDRVIRVVNLKDD